MEARTLWKGVLRLKNHEVPVRLYSAAKDHTVRFRLLHKADHEPVEQKMVNPDTGKEVEREKMRKGAEVEPGVFVLLEEEDLAGLEPEPSRTIEISRFVPRSQLDHEWYDRPYFLGPDGKDDAYWALAKALGDSDEEGIAHWVMRKREYVGSLFAHEGYLALVTLRFADEVVEPEEIEMPKNTDLQKSEIQMAEQLISALEKEFDPRQYRDEFHDRVVELIETKARGGKMKLEKAKRKRKPASLSDALRASLAEASKRKGQQNG
jgi:DNA end-binding protein Ku